MPEEPNPYASPAPISHDHQPSPVDPLGPLRGPSIGPLLSSGLVLAASLLFLPEFIPQLWPPRRDFADSLFAVPMFLASVPIFLEAWNMRQGTRYRLAYAAAVLTSIPMLTPALYWGIPLGIWALIVLHRGDIRAVFAARDLQEVTDPVS